MVLFWHNHFTSSMLKVRYAPALFRQNALFRREALGNFATLLKAVARDPAMLIYLDGIRIVAEDWPVGIVTVPDVPLKSPGATASPRVTV